MDPADAHPEARRYLAIHSYSQTAFDSMDHRRNRPTAPRPAYPESRWSPACKEARRAFLRARNGTAAWQIRALPWKYPSPGPRSLPSVKEAPASAERAALARASRPPYRSPPQPSALLLTLT